MAVTAILKSTVSHSSGSKPLSFILKKGGFRVIELLLTLLQFSHENNGKNNKQGQLLLLKYVNGLMHYNCFYKCFVMQELWL